MDNDPGTAALNRALPELAKDPSILAIELGGSRGLGLAQPDSDFDLIVYFEQGRPAGNELILRQLKGVITDHSLSPNGQRIIARMGQTRLEFFFRDIAVLDRQVEEIRQGTVRLKPNAWMPQSKLNFEHVALLTHCKVLHDPQGKLEAIRQAVMPMPQPYQAQLLKFAIEGAGNALHTMSKAQRAPDHTNYVMGYIFLFTWYLEIGIFAVNGLYPFWNKQTSAYAARLKRAPKDYLNRVHQIYGAAVSLAARQCYDGMSSLLKELREG